MTGEWREIRWLRRHAIAAPFGVFATTALLTALSGQWSGWKSLELASSLVDLGAVLYGMAAVLAERGVRMVFWALDERRKWRAKLRDDIKNELKAELIAEMLAAEDFPKTKQDLERWAQEKGIPVDQQPPK